MQHESTIIPHWSYFLSLEEDLYRIARYIEFSEKNYQCYSMELARLLFAASSEIDIVAKQYCKIINPRSRTRSITGYKHEILANDPCFPNIKIGIPRYGLTFEPWSTWNDGNNPLWWRAYNNVKHERNEYFSEANLKNTLNSVAALYVLLIFFYRKEAAEGKLSPNPKLLIPKEPFEIDFLFWGERDSYVYGFDNL